MKFDAVLAFATDEDSQDALQEGLVDYADAQVWRGTVATASAVLERASDIVPRLLFVDLDDTPFPAGAIHHLATVCDADTAVVALGSDASAQFCREILLAGVSDYLVKPVAAAAVREAATRALAPAAPGQDGCAAGFAGSGGSGATTLAAAVALLAAERGRYAAALDLDRAFPALAFALDVEPAPGLDQLLDAADGAHPEPATISGIAARRSDRIAVYGYRQGAAPPPPAPAAVLWLIGELKQRYHLVLVDGYDDPAALPAVLAGVDVRIVVFEPTAAGARRGARLLALLGKDLPVVAAQNHTRAFRRRQAEAALGHAGLATPDIVVPFEGAVPRLADRGWPKNRLAAALRKPASALVDRLLAPSRAGAETAPA